MTKKYAPKGFDESETTKVLHLVGIDVEPFDDCCELWVKCDDDQCEHDYRLIPKGYLLKLACQAYIGDKRAGLTVDEAMIAHLAGYDVADRDGDIWRVGTSYCWSLDFSAFRTPFSITSTNGEHDDEQETVTVPKAKLDALQKELDALRGNN